MMPRIATIIALTLCRALTSAADEPPSGALEHRLNSTVDRAIAHGRIVGAVVIVMRDGKMIYHRAAGYLDREAKISMSEGAIFRLASSSKAITSAAVMALIDQGRLGLDDPVIKYIPAFDANGKSVGTAIELR